MVHKRYRNPRQGYSRPSAKEDMTSTISREMYGLNRPIKLFPEPVSSLMAPEPSPAPPTDLVSPQSGMDPLDPDSMPKPELLEITQVVRGAASQEEPRQGSKVMDRIDRLLAMLRRSR